MTLNLLAFVRIVYKQFLQINHTPNHRPFINVHMNRIDQIIAKGNPEETHTNMRRAGNLHKVRSHDLNPGTEPRTSSA